MSAQGAGYVPNYAVEGQLIDAIDISVPIEQFHEYPGAGSSQTGPLQSGCQNLWVGGATGRRQ